MTFKMTHIGLNFRCRQQLVNAVSREQAQAWMEQLYGPALVLSAMCIRRPS